MNPYLLKKLETLVLFGFVVHFHSYSVQYIFRLIFKFSEESWLPVPLDIKRKPFGILRAISKSVNEV